MMLMEMRLLTMMQHEKYMLRVVAVDEDSSDEDDDAAATGCGC